MVAGPEDCGGRGLIPWIIPAMYGARRIRFELYWSVLGAALVLALAPTFFSNIILVVIS